MNRTLLVDLQVQDYKKTLELQRGLIAQCALGLLPDVLLLVEHPHVITMGKSGRRENVLSRRFPVYEVERGGDVTYHGYGQLVGYPILNLSPRNKDIRDYLRRLERTLITTLADFGIPSRMIEGRPGVWVGDRKIASIGIAIRNWITFHGFALNVSTDLSCFDTINPCGYGSKIMTSITRELARDVSISEVKGPLVQAFENIFDTKFETTDIGSLPCLASGSSSEY